MIAFVLSGGGNRGALQAGAVQALLSQNIVPDILVGTSVGAINAAYLAYDPTPATAQALERVWNQVTKDDVYPGSRMTVLWRLLRERTSLFPSDKFYQFLRRHMPAGADTFADVTAANLYIVATHLETGQMHVFGECPTDRVIDAIMASTALPPLHPPWCVDGEYYVDGGAVSDLPLRVAVDKGAQTIYALHLPAPVGPLPLVYTLGDIADRAISALVQQQVALDFETVAHARGITLHHIELHPPSHLELSFRDFSQSAKLISLGRAQTEQFLDERHLRPASRRERLLAAVRGTVERTRAALREASDRSSQTTGRQYERGHTFFCALRGHSLPQSIRSTLSRGQP